MVVIYHEDVNTSWSCWIGLNRTHQRHDEPVRIGTRQRESILDIADTEKHMYSSWSRFVTVMKMMKMSWRLLTIQKKSPSICSAFLVIQPTNRCTWKRRLAPWNQPEKWCKLHPPNSWSSASLGNILMIAIDLGCVNEPGSVSMIVSELMAPREMFLHKTGSTLPKVSNFSPPDLGRIQVYKYWLYMHI